jgi:CRISPR-associated protein Cmr6
MRKFICDLAGDRVKKDNKYVRPNDRRGQHAEKGSGQHPGLLLQRYLCENAAGEHGNPEEKRAILHAAINAAANEEVRALYRIAFNRWSASLPTGSIYADLATSERDSRLIVGLGSENVLEIGIRLHHTYGMPNIPGSALKGLAAHYCDQVWGERHIETPSAEARRFRGERREDKQRNQKVESAGQYHQLLFGTTDDSGCITFHDAWLTPDSLKPLVLDVMTPHHPKWLDGSTAPTDFDSPTPVPFLAVTGVFRVAVSWHGPASDKAKSWMALARSLLHDALKDWGIGGKTTSGYGRLILPPPPPPPRKRASGEKAKVKIIAPRPKVGFEVQDIEPARNPGTLTLGTPPPGTDTNPGAVVEVLVHDDKPDRPQYKWPQPPKK